MDDPVVSGNYTIKSREAIQHSGNIERRPYAFCMGFKERLKEARLAASLTGDQLGQAIGCSKQNISHWESGRYEPNIDFILKISERLGVSTEWLLTGKEVAGLSADAVKQARFYEGLSADERRKWEAAKMLITSGVPNTGTPHSDTRVNKSTTRNDDTNMKRTDTVITAGSGHVEFTIPRPTKDVSSAERNSDPDTKSSERSKRTTSVAAPRRTRRN